MRLMERCEAIRTMFCVGDPADCFCCAEFVTTCDRCHMGGHTDSGWHGIEQEDGQPFVLCDDCCRIEDGEWAWKGECE